MSTASAGSPAGCRSSQDGKESKGPKGTAGTVEQSKLCSTVLIVGKIKLLHLQNKRCKIIDMLTQEDLEQIGKLMDGRLEPIKQDIQGLKSDVSVLKEDVQGVKQDVQGLKDGQARIEQRLDHVDQKVDYLERMAKDDGEILGDISARLNDVLTDHDVRIERLEKHTGLSHS